MAKLVRYHGEEWSALYIDGKLDLVGDTYLTDERIAELLGVEEHYSDAFLRGGNQREDVAKNLDELKAYEDERNQKLQRAAEMRAEAKRLEAEANALT